MNAFELLHPTIQEAVWKQAWKELRPLQVDAIHQVVETQNDLILSAATASGKTEAAFLPILSQIAQSPGSGIRALYVSPLKALINDQFGRLDVLCEYAQIPVHRWHGDVSSDLKRKLRQQPEGVLLITPESLESHCINYGTHLRRMYENLEYVVIDELHAFLDDVRGVHLRSLLSRIVQAADCSPRRLGLSATLGDFLPAQQFLNPLDPTSVKVLQEPGGNREIRAGLKSFIRPARLKGADDQDDLSAERAIARDVAARFRKGTNLVFFNSRGLTEELADLLNELEEAEKWPKNPFLIHHGSLSKEIREETEADLKSGRPVTALCTRTLEMGIDIGAVQCVGQVGAPWEVSSLVQRIGRSGRRPGEAQMLRMYVIDDALAESSTFTDRLYPELLRGIAMVELMLARWVETPRNDWKHYSTFIHQILSVLRQTGGIRADRAYVVLCTKGAFSSITKQEFAAILRSLANHEVIQQMESGEIILAPDGERVVESRDFYAAFASAEEYSVEHEADKIGMLPYDHIPPPGEHLLLAGRRWCVEHIEHPKKCVYVHPARGKRVPLFLGKTGSIAQVVMQKMQEILHADNLPPYLHPDAVSMLVSARHHYGHSCKPDHPIVETLGGVCVLPWAGSAIHQTLVVLAKADQFQAELSRDGLMITYPNRSLNEVKTHWHRIASGSLPLDSILPFVGDPTHERFDDWVPEDLLLKAFASECLDLAGTKAFVGAKLQALQA